MAQKPSEARYAEGGEIRYITYHSPQPLRTGRTQDRERVQRLYFPANARDIRLEGPPQMVEKRTGRRVYGVVVHYKAKLSQARARRGETMYTLPERWADRTKIVELPEGATDIRMTDHPPEGPMMAVA